MIKKSYLNLWAKEGKEHWLLNPSNISLFLFYLLLLFLPTQAGIHFWPDFSIVKGLRIDYLSPTIYLTDILIFIIFLINAKKILIQVIRLHLKKLLFFLLLLTSFFIGVINAQNPMAGVLGIIKFSELVFLGTYIYLNKDKIDITKVAALLCIGVVFESFLALLQYLNKASFQGLFYFLGERNFNSFTPGVANVSVNGSLVLRPYGTFSHPNTLAGFLVISLASSLFFIKKLNIYVIAAFAIGIGGIIVSFSRTGLIAFIFFLLGFFLISIYEKYKKGKLNQYFKNKNTPILLALVLIIITLSFFQFSQRTINFNFQEESVSVRTKLAAQSIQMTYLNPVFGVGLNNFYDNLAKEFNSPGLIQPVHNIFLLALSETGIIGLFILAAVLIKAGLKSLYNLLIVCVILILGMFDHYLFTQQQGQVLFSIIVSLLIAFKLSAKI